MEMLDKTEIKFLRKTEAFNPEYRHILRLRIRRKISRLKDALRLLMESEFSNEIALFITENCSALRNSVTLVARAIKSILSIVSEISWRR